MRIANLRLLTLSFALVGTVSVAAAPLELSTGGLGDAKFGMNVEAVEKGLGANLSFGKAVTKSGVPKLDCAYARIDGVSGVSLRFEHGRFTVASIDKPTVTTKSGFKVGDRESDIISKFKSDPTYKRYPNHYDDAVKEIYLGKAEHGTRNGQENWQGQMIKFTSKRGVVTMIEAGAADYIMLSEHDEECQH